MKALTKKHAEPGIWLEDIPEPSIGPNDVLIRVRRTAICGTDIHIYRWDDWAKATIPVPMAVGHEFSGEIVELGSEVYGLVAAETVEQDAATCASTPSVLASIVPARLPSTSQSPRAMCSNCPMT